MRCVCISYDSNKIGIVDIELVIIGNINNNNKYYYYYLLLLFLLLSKYDTKLSHNSPFKYFLGTSNVFISKIEL